MSKRDALGRFLLKHPKPSPWHRPQLWFYLRAYIPTAGRVAVWMLRANPDGTAPRISDPLFPREGYNSPKLRQVIIEPGKSRCRVRFRDVWVRWFEAPNDHDMWLYRHSPHALEVVTEHGRAMRARMLNFEMKKRADEEPPYAPSLANAQREGMRW